MNRLSQTMKYHKLTNKGRVSRQFTIGKCTTILNLITVVRVNVSASVISGYRARHRYPRFAGSNPAEVDGFFQDVKILSIIPPGGTLSRESRVCNFMLAKEPHA